MWFVNGLLREKTERNVANRVMEIVKDPDVAKKLIPNYIMGCKRITPSNDYLHAYNRDNVTLVTDQIKCFMEDGIKTEGGTSYEVDTIVYATGFVSWKSCHTYESFGLVEDNLNRSEENGVVARSGRVSLQEEWGDAPNAYLALTYPKYPNMFFLQGPGSILVHNTVVFMTECGISYIIDAIRKMVNYNIKSIHVKKQVNDNYQAWAQECLKNKSFMSPTCTSWYRNSKGLNFAVWPSHLTLYWWLTRKVNLNDYICN